MGDAKQARTTDQQQKLKDELRAFLDAHDDICILEDGLEVFQEHCIQWRLEIEFGKLLFEVWNSERSIVRRIEGVVDSTEARLVLLAWRPQAFEASTLELRDASRAVGPASGLRATSARRAVYRRELGALVAREHPAGRVEKLSNRSDREHVFSAWYTRGWVRERTHSWAFLGLGPEEHPAAADAVLSYALIWLNWLGKFAKDAGVPALKLFLPPDAVALTAHRAAYLDRGRVEIEVFEWIPGETSPRRIDVRDFGNVDTRLTPRRASERIQAQYEPMLRDLAGRDFDRLDFVADASGNGASLRVRGFEIARIDGQTEPRIYFGLESNVQRLTEATQPEFRRFVSHALELRTAASPDPSHPLYREQPERWLESLLVRDLTRVDPALLPEYVYPQVPAFSGPASPAMSRGVIDILGVTRAGEAEGHRLAVVELKLHEEINLPVQGLDYWLRVKWLHERNQFQEFGYFPGLKLDPAPPRLYLVSPAFRFHSTTGDIIRYFDPSVEVIQVGLNDAWREGIKVLFRRPAVAGRIANGE